jgi:LPS sulfotransferase NodH
MTDQIWFPRFEGNVHRDGLCALFRHLQVGTGDLQHYESIVLICFTNRCGSNYLAAALASTGAMNEARELLNVEHAADYPDKATFADFLRAALQDQQLGGRLAIKLGVPHLEILGEAGLLDLWRDQIHYVFIERADRLAQAISWEIALQSGSWHSGIEAQGLEPVYDRARVEAAINYFADGNRTFDVFFGMNGLKPTHVLYEDLAGCGKKAFQNGFDTIQCGL